MNKVKTTKIGGGADYAKVADRLKLFWEQNPNGKIETERENIADNKVRFIARIWRNGADVIELAKTGATAEIIKMTANATGSADATKKGDKENEKLETVAVGRALAMLGYLASGEVASREEMEEFEEYKKEQKTQAIMQAIEALQDCKSLDEMRELWGKFQLEIRIEPTVIAAKDKMKKQFAEQTKEENESPANSAK